MISELNNAIGKRLTHIIKGTTDKPWMLVFEDGVICQIGIELGWESCDDELVDELEFDVSEYRREELIAAGVVDDEWFRKHDEKREFEKRRAAELAEEREREMYEALKRKFESR